MLRLEHLDLVFPQEYLKATLMISLLTVWVLVGLFYYLNRYTRRDYFAIWTAGWLFYALWLTVCMNWTNGPMGSIMFILKQCCVSLSAVFLLWGSLRFLGLPVRQSLFGMFMLFLLVWTIISPQVITSMLQVQLPIFILLGGSSLFAGVCFYRLRRKKAFVGAGMLSLGFLLWGLYLGTYPFSQEYSNLYSAGFFVSAVLQLFIAVSMIVLVLEEVRETMVQKERLHSIGKVAVGMAHDVNNALSPIVGYSELLLRTLPTLDENSRQILKQVGVAAENVAQIVAKMREVYNRELGSDSISQPMLTEFPLPVEFAPTGKIEIKMSPAEKVLAKHKIETLPPRTTAPSRAPAPGTVTSAKTATATATAATNRTFAETLANPVLRDREPCRPLRILYIDDDPMVRRLVQDILELNEHQVTAAASGKEGLEMFRANLGGMEPFEVVITDFGMPEMDGRCVAREIRNASPQTPILMLTGWGTMLKEDGQVIPEVDAVMAKPPHLDELNNFLFQVTSKQNN